MIVYPILQFLVFYVYMNFSNFMLAFQGMNKDGSKYYAGFDNFIRVFNGVDTELIFTSFWNNIKMFFWTLVIGMPLNILFGFYLFKKKFGHKIIRIVYMLPGMVSGVVMSLIFLKLVQIGIPNMMRTWFDREIPNLLFEDNTAFGIQIFYTLWLGFSSSIIYYSNAMFAIDQSMLEAAKIDGASPIRQLFSIVVPNITPMLSTFMITGVASIFTAAGHLFLFYGLSDVPVSTYMTGYYMFKIAYTGELTAYPTAAAVSIIITVITIPLALGTRKLMDWLNPLKDVQKEIA